jgi:hypothetical protein
MEKLTAGFMSAFYDKGFLRRISYGETEVLRMIYFALRDHNWNTISYRIENEQISRGTSDFSITYDCYHQHDGADVMAWKAAITGKPDGSIDFQITGRALVAFRKNRAGFCLLHPLSLTGEECHLSHADGASSTERFPEHVAPDNPFKNIRSMKWESAGTPYVLSFEGDAFETEDQRNWCDASFKTFCTPLDQPFPVTLRKGQEVFQRVTFQSAIKLAKPAEPRRHVALRDTGLRTVIPAIGIAASTEVLNLSPEAVLLLRALVLSHYRIDLTPAGENWVTMFSQQYENAYALGLPLEVALHVTDNYQEEMEGFSLLCQQNKVKVKKLLVIPSNGLVTRTESIREARRIRETMPKIKVGAGSNYNFNEINKNHFDADGLDFISFSMDPQEHAIDDLTILENIEAMSHLVESARAIYGNSLAIHISPVTLKKRFNPYATNPQDLYLPESIKADPRQKTDFAAIWTFGTLCSLTRAKTETVTYFQTIGNQGILSTDAVPYPVYHTLKTVGQWQGKPAYVIESSDPLRVQGILFDNKVLGMVNLTGNDQEVRYHDLTTQLGPREIKFEKLNRA